MRIYKVFITLLCLIATGVLGVAVFAQPSLPQDRAIVITGNAQGTTGAVVATLPAKANYTTYICGFHLDSTGSGAMGPITLAGIVNGPMVFQGTAGANNNPSQTFYPCIPASAPNTAITITTTADGTATAVDVNMWGYQQ